MEMDWCQNHEMLVSKEAADNCVFDTDTTFIIQGIEQLMTWAEEASNPVGMEESIECPLCWAVSWPRDETLDEDEIVNKIIYASINAYKNTLPEIFLN
jgi:hypothetical protein